MSRPNTTRHAWLMAPAVAILFATVPASAQQSPLAHTAGDPSLKWSGCPDFMPRGCGIAVLHGDPAKDNADVFFRVPANAEIPRHWHTSAERMVLVAGEMSISYDGHAPLTLKPEGYAYGPPKLPHSAVCGDAGPCVLFIAFESPVDAIAGGPGEK